MCAYTAGPKCTRANKTLHARFETHSEERSRKEAIWFSVPSSTFRWEHQPLLFVMAGLNLLNSCWVIQLCVHQGAWFGIPLDVIVSNFHIVHGVRWRPCPSTQDAYATSTTFLFIVVTDCLADDPDEVQGPLARIATGSDRLSRGGRAYRISLKSLARRYLELHVEIADLAQ